MDAEPPRLGGGELRGRAALLRPAGRPGRVLRLPERGAGGDPGVGRRAERAAAPRSRRGRAARGLDRPADGRRCPLRHRGRGSRPHRAARAAGGRSRARLRARVRRARGRCGGRGALRPPRRGAAVLHPARARRDRLPRDVRRRIAGHPAPGAGGAGAGAGAGADRKAGPNRLRGLRRVPGHLAPRPARADRRRALPELRGAGPRRHLVSARDHGR